MKVTPVKTKLFREGDSLPDFVLTHVRRLKEGSVLVVSSKLVSLSEWRTAPIELKDRLIRKESNKAKKTQKVWFTITDGIVMANAGIDESNGQGKLILLPKDSYKAAAALRDTLMRAYKLKRLGVIITDSVIMPLRKGVVGVALGYVGFRGIRDYKGKKDLFGRKFRFASTNVADSLATAAMVTMGEGEERQPIAIIEDAPVTFGKGGKGEIQITEKTDMYGPLLRALKQKP